MICGVGLDLVEVDRVARAMRNPRFVRRILTPAEREYCRTAEQVAGRWAAKEATAKALPFRLSWQDVEILPDVDSKLAVRVTHPSFEGTLWVSITHERSMAAAFAIYERDFAG
ncbi:MAG: holo-ACP synthase [Methanoregulaceae archaeon]|nr:holo-ACP synthase [Methanoregulaceae archaeon]